METNVCRKCGEHLWEVMDRDVVRWISDGGLACPIHEREGVGEDFFHDVDDRHPWQQAHDALAAHGRAKMAGVPESELRVLWDAYCIALTKAVE